MTYTAQSNAVGLEARCEAPSFDDNSGATYSSLYCNSSGVHAVDADDVDGRITAPTEKREPVAAAVCRPQYGRNCRYHSVLR